MIIQKKNLKKTLFIDIETVSVARAYADLPETSQLLWKTKSRQFLKDRTQECSEEDAALFYNQKAGIFAEFARVVCITVGYLSLEKNEQPILRLKSFSGDENFILSSFSEMMDHHYDDLDEHFICGHNVKEFDIPFLCRRMIINQLRLPRLLNISGKKPWQVGHLLDTMEMWRFGDYKNYTSLSLLAGTLGIPTPKDDIDGSMVGHVFWEENDIERIVAYCEKDVLTVVQVMMRFAGLALIEPENIVVVKDE